MHVEKLIEKSDKVIPVMAAIPYRISIDDEDEEGALYDPQTQRTLFAGKGYCTCRRDESTGGFFSSKSDTKKDD